MLGLQANRCWQVGGWSRGGEGGLYLKPVQVVAGAGLPMLTAGWLGKEVSKKPEEKLPQQLTFSFQAQLQAKSSSTAGLQAPVWQIPASAAQGLDEATMLRQALKGLVKQGGLYLTPVLYRPTVQVSL